MAKAGCTTTRCNEVLISCWSWDVVAALKTTNPKALSVKTTPACTSACMSSSNRADWELRPTQCSAHTNTKTTADQSAAACRLQRDKGPYLGVFLLQLCDLRPKHVNLIPVLAAQARRGWAGEQHVCMRVIQIVDHLAANAGGGRWAGQRRGRRRQRCLGCLALGLQENGPWCVRNRA